MKASEIVSTAAQRAAVAPLMHTGDSANIAFYRETGGYGRVWVEVRRDDFASFRPMVPKKVPTFEVRIYRDRDKVATVTYEPKSKPRPGALSAVTVTRIVRKALA